MTPSLSWLGRSQERVVVVVVEKPTGLDRDARRDVEGTAGVDGTGAGQTGAATNATLTETTTSDAGRDFPVGKRWLKEPPEAQDK